MEIINLAPLVGMTFESAAISDDKESMIFMTAEGAEYTFRHIQDCCESVNIEDVVGDLGDLVGTPIVMAEKVTTEDEWPAGAPKREYEPESYTWTFYKFATIKGRVTVRWFGESNGYYSESVDLFLPSGVYWNLED